MNKIFFSILMLVSIVIVPQASLLGAKPDKITDKSLFHIYLLMGQSNMLGRGGGTAQDKDKPLNPKILMLDKELKWKTAKDPLHFDNPRAGVGMGISFAQFMLANDPHVTIGLVPCAKGGSKLSAWSKDNKLYTAAIQRTNHALKTGTLKGILWHQGESDGKNKKTSDTYSHRLIKTIADFRKELNAPQLPFVIGNIGRFIEDHPKYPFAKNINQQLTEVANKVPHCSCVSSDGLTHIGDRVHFDAKSQRSFGKEYAKQMLALTQVSGPQKLFDGKSLTGWRGDPELWSVKDGVIFGTTHNKKLTKNSFLIWNGQASDFHLTYEAKVEGANSGMQYRSQVIDETMWRLKGYQADIHPNHPYIAMCYGEGLGRGIIAQRGQKVIVSQETGKPEVIGKTAPVTPLDITKWHTYEVICKSNHIIHKVDGTIAIDLIDNHKDKLLRGTFGIQLHVGEKMKAWFKNITLETY